PEPGAALVARVNGRLAQVAAATGSAVIYVIGADGITLAASNAGGAGSFVGRDYAFRPYFRQALANGSGSQFALGTVSGRPGLYLARRLANAAGVVVVKVEFDAVEAAWRAAGDSVFVTDSRGIVLVASDPGWRFSALRTIGEAERGRIRENLEFGTAPLEMLPLHPAEGGADLSLTPRPVERLTGEHDAPSGRAKQDGVCDARQPCVVRVGRGALPAWPALLLDAGIPGTDWRLHTLT
ncbi:hypothetical protein ACFQ12_16575, partial [Methylobacterium trifolii]